MNTPTMIGGAIGLATMAAVGTAAGALADRPFSPITITATDSSGNTGYVVWDPANGRAISSSFAISRTGADEFEIRDASGAHLGTLLSAGLATQAGSVELGFSVRAGVTDTNFHISSGVLDVGPIANAFARAEASMTLFNMNGGTASFLGGFDDGSAYRALYSSIDRTDTSIFTGLLGDASVSGPGSSTDFGSTFPLADGDFTALGTGVDGISAAFSFTLTAGDLAEGHSLFTVIPTPSTLALLGAGSILALRRRR